MTLAYPFRSLVDLEVFRGSLGTSPDQPGTAQFLGFREVRSSTRTDATAWASITPEVYFEDGAGRRARAGDVYERQVLIQPDGSPSYGPWRYVGDSRALKGEYGRAANVDWMPTIQPGGVMRTPLATPLYDDEGALINRPAVGEQDLDPWTGEPLVNEQGDPVLVTE